MKKVTSVIIALVILNKTFGQIQLLLPKVYAYKNTCSGKELNNRDMFVMCSNIFGSNFHNARNLKDEFAVNDYISRVMELYENAKKQIFLDKECYVTIEFKKYSYNFVNETVEVKYGTNNRYEHVNYSILGYTEGYQYFGGQMQYIDAPSLMLSSGGMPTTYKMPKDIAAKSFKYRTGQNRPPFKVKFIFKLSVTNTDKCKS